MGSQQEDVGVFYAERLFCKVDALINIVNFLFYSRVLVSLKKTLLSLVNLKNSALGKKCTTYLFCPLSLCPPNFNTNYHNIVNFSAGNFLLNNMGINLLLHRNRIWIRNIIKEFKFKVSIV